MVRALPSVRYASQRVRTSPSRNFSSSVDYLKGAFGGFFHSEALPNALPPKQNSPQHPPYGLYPELLSGTSFTQPRNVNKYTWQYRIRPAVQHEPVSMSLYEQNKYFCVHAASPCPPMQYRFPKVEPLERLGQPHSSEPLDFIDGITTMALNGNGQKQDGATANVFSCSKSMCDGQRQKVFRNNDADMLIMPQEGKLRIRTELGELEVGQLELALIPRGMVMQINLVDGVGAKGYLLENFGAPFVIPDLGPIGISGGNAHPRHFVAPQAKFDDVDGADFEFVQRFQDRLWTGQSSVSPFDVVAWYGNYVPCKYDMRNFMAINTVSYDHPDPSIGVVMASYTASPGLANIDFVIFPPRYVVSENTFRPPWFHRNYMSECMGLLKGAYDAKAGFVPGAMSIHNAFTAHGPDRSAVDAGSNLDTLQAQRYSGTMAFMWESNKVWQPTEYALQVQDKGYKSCWGSIEKRFDPNAVTSSNPPFPFDPERTL